MLPKK
jgi:hypothetical protein